MDGIHIHHQITDYVLELLPVEERRVVARHVAGCDECREAVRREREIGRLLHSTINKAAAPDYGRLQSLMPVIPTRRSPLAALFAPHRQWALACLLLVAMMGAFLFGGNGSYHLPAETADNEAATLSSIHIAGTAEHVIIDEMGTLYTSAVQPTIPAEQSRTFTGSAPEQLNPPAAPLPAAPQVTPAPEATYYQ